MAFIKLMPGVSREDVSGVTVLVDEAGNAAVLNSTAGMILDLFLAGCSCDDAADVMCERFSVARDEALRDALEVAAMLVDKALVERC